MKHLTLTNKIVIACAVVVALSALYFFVYTPINNEKKLQACKTKYQTLYTKVWDDTCHNLNQTWNCKLTPEDANAVSKAVEKELEVCLSTYSR